MTGLTYGSRGARLLQAVAARQGGEPIEAMDRVEIEICPHEPRADVFSDVDPAGALYDDMRDCTGGGDVEPACQYVVDTWLPRFVIWDAAAKTHRTATPEEMRDTCRAIYSDSESDFSDQNTAALYLVWQAASDLMERETL